MEIAEHIDALGAEGRRLTAAAAAAGLDAEVPSCAGWVVRDLVRHQGGVHRWATGIVAGPRAEAWDVDLDEVVGAWPADADLLGWFGDGLDQLTEVLIHADPGLACWTLFAAPSPLAMWARRQAHETAVHRVDAELAAGWPVTELPAPFAADGVSELLTCFITRPRGQLRADPARLLRVRCTDAAGDWMVRIGPDRVETTSRADQPGPPSRADCLVSGGAHDLYLALWNRRSPAGLAVDGDRSTLDLFLDRVRIG